MQKLNLKHLINYGQQLPINLKDKAVIILKF